MRLVVDVATGTIAQQIDYPEFGVVLADTNPGFQPFGFAGGLYEPATELVSFGAREYAPRFGRWMSKDPYGFPDGGNRYTYALSDPINYIDPSGLYSWDEFRGDVAAVGGFIGNGAAGVADGLTFGGTTWLLDKAGVPVDPCSLAFKAGGILSEVVPTPMGWLSKGFRGIKWLRKAKHAASEADELVVIGRQWDTAVARDWEGHSVLDIPDWSLPKNDAWVGQAIV